MRNVRAWAASLLMVAAAGVALAGPLEDADDAHEHGDFAIALRIYRALADRGDVTAQYNLGNMLAQGEGAPADYAQAALWYRKAADQNDIDAQKALGDLYRNGNGVPQDYAAAVAWYRK